MSSARRRPFPRTPSIPRAGGLAPLLLVGLLLTGSPSPAAEIEDVSFPDVVRAGDRELPLRGLGLLRYRIVFRGYVGALYLPAQIPSARVLDDVPKALELRYFWSIEGKLFGDAAAEVLERTRNEGEMAALQERLDRINTLYRDVEPGDRYRLTYVPGEGMTLALNGETLGTIPGADFAAAYFSIWLGEEPIDEGFRDKLLAGR